MGFFVDKPVDTFVITSVGKTTNGWLCDILDIITLHFPVSLCHSFPRYLLYFTLPDMNTLFLDGKIENENILLLGL